MRRSNHEGDHLSLDNRTMWQGTPGAPVFWANASVRGPADFESKQQMARIQGFEGEECSECGSMQMVRDGRCLKCMVCGSTTGGCA